MLSKEYAEFMLYMVPQIGARQRPALPSPTKLSQELEIERNILECL